jgi:hypothetical protein
MVKKKNFKIKMKIYKKRKKNFKMKTKKHIKIKKLLKKRKKILKCNIIQKKEKLLNKIKLLYH